MRAAPICLLLTLLAAAELYGQSAATLYEGARLVPGDGSAAIEQSAFLVENGTIARVAKKGALSVPAGAARVDLTGKTVIPTLINVHTHPGFQRGETYAPENYGRDTYLADLNRALYYGVSAVVSQGIDPGDLAFQIRAEQAAGKLGGARLFTAGRGIGAPNAGPGAAAYRGIAYEVTTEEAGRQAVREQAARKVDLIKIWVDDRNGRAPRLSPPIYRAIVDEAHKLGLRINAHVFYLSDVKELVDASIDGFAHLARDLELDDQAVREIVRRRVYVMTTLATPERTTHTSVPASVAAWLESPEARPLTAPVIQRVRAAFGGRDQAAAAGARDRYAILQRSVAKLAAAGARIVLGSDTGIQDHPFGFTDHRELELLVEAGMTPMQAIVAATSRGAEYLNLRDRGTLAAGMRADFVVLDANPLENIANTKRIARVFAGGREVDRAAIAARGGP